MKALIKPSKDQFYFNLIAANGKVISTSERYTRKRNLLKTLKRYFPLFEIVDETR
jgi:uncharacterized protein YegP (UPF0339 family)